MILSEVGKSCIVLVVLSIDGSLFFCFVWHLVLLFLSFVSRVTFSFGGPIVFRRTKMYRPFGLPCLYTPSVPTFPPSVVFTYIPGTRSKYRYFLYCEYDTSKYCCRCHPSWVRIRSPVKPSLSGRLKPRERELAKIRSSAFMDLECFHYLNAGPFFLFIYFLHSTSLVLVLLCFFWHPMCSCFSPGFNLDQYIQNVYPPSPKQSRLFLC